MKVFIDENENPYNGFMPEMDMTKRSDQIAYEIYHMKRSVDEIQEKFGGVSARDLFLAANTYKYKRAAQLETLIHNIKIKMPKPVQMVEQPTREDSYKNLYCWSDESETVKNFNPQKYL